MFAAKRIGKIEAHANLAVAVEMEATSELASILRPLPARRTEVFGPGQALLLR